MIGSSGSIGGGGLLIALAVTITHTQRERKRERICFWLHFSFSWVVSNFSIFFKYFLQVLPIARTYLHNEWMGFWGFENKTQLVCSSFTSFD